jgi:hypothetical protein
MNPDSRRIGPNRFISLTGVIILVVHWQPTPAQLTCSSRQVPRLLVACKKLSSAARADTRLASLSPFTIVFAAR